MDLGTALTLGFLWLLFSLISGKKKSREGSRPRVPQRRPESEAARRAQLPLPLPPPSGGRAPHPDATQREGFRLESLLKELARTLDQSSGPLGRAPDIPRSRAEETEVATSLEAPVGVVSRELPVTREERLSRDQDDEAEQIVARRIAAAAARSGPLTAADHVKFDNPIRQEPADHTATSELSFRQLRQAVIWREILGPPVGLRDLTGRLTRDEP